MQPQPEGEELNANAREGTGSRNLEQEELQEVMKEALKIHQKYQITPPLHHGNHGDHKAKVGQSLGRGVPWQGQGRGGPGGVRGGLSRLICCPPEAPCKVSESQPASEVGPEQQR